MYFIPIFFNLNHIKYPKRKNPIMMLITPNIGNESRYVSPLTSNNIPANIN